LEDQCLFGRATIVCVVLPFITPRFFKHYGGRPSELETKFLLLMLFGLCGLATWSGSEAVLPTDIVGMVLAGTVGKDHSLIRRLRTRTFGLLTNHTGAIFRPGRSGGCERCRSDLDR
jgi:Kef-type K+ transport system membrane component KefB